MVVSCFLSAGKLSSLSQYFLSAWDKCSRCKVDFACPLSEFEIRAFVSSLGRRDCLLYSIYVSFSNKYRKSGKKDRQGIGNVKIKIILGNR